MFLRQLVSVSGGLVLLAACGSKLDSGALDAGKNPISEKDGSSASGDGDAHGDGDHNTRPDAGHSAGDAGHATHDAGPKSEKDGGSDAGAGTGPRATCPGGMPPPDTWMEHWFEHVQNVKRVYTDDCVAIYFDDDMPKDSANWLFPFVSNVWKYSLATYGYMGPDRTFAIFHNHKYYGGHPAYFYSDFHDYRNTSDVGGDDFPDGDYDVTSHEIGHIVESTASHTKHGSPAFGLWKDSKWMEFYQYDVYVGLGMTEHAKVVFDRFSNTQDDFPRAGTHWFRDWFYPLWRDHGHSQVMVNFYALLEQYFPANGNMDMRDMNWGEYIHFTSGAAGTNLKDQATQAFGWPDEWEQQFQQAQKDFPDIKY
jgi:hypothetical protein